MGCIVGRLRPTLAVVIAMAAACASHGRRGPAESFRVLIDAQRTLRLTGTGASETIVVTVDAGAGLVEVSHQPGRGNPVSTVFPLSAFDRVAIAGGDGDDFINVVDAAETLDRHAREIAVSGGPGENAVVFSHAPFGRDTALRMRSLARVSRQVDELAAQAADAAAGALEKDAMGHAAALRVNVVDEMQRLTADIETEVFAPAQELLEQRAPRAGELGDAFQTRVSELEKEHAALAAELTALIESRVVLPARGREPSRAEVMPPLVRQRVESFELRARDFADATGAETETAAAEIETSAAGIESRALQVKARGERLAAAGETLAADIDNDLRGSMDRVLIVVGRLQSVTSALDSLAPVVRDELARAVDAADTGGVRALALAQKTGADCTTPQTTRTYSGDSGFDLFLPLSAPSESWSIDGGDGFNILLGGHAADDIRGGSGTDIVAGLDGDDQIRGGGGTDLLFGDFFTDFGSWAGNDCIRGEDGIDIIVGSAGDDTLTGGADIDFAFGDDLQDFLSDSADGGSDDIEGNDGIDLLFGEGGGDTIDGGYDIDLILGNAGPDIIHGRDGRDVTIGDLTVHLGNLLAGMSGDDEIHGGKGVDVILGGDDPDRAWGGQQIDLMFGGAGADEMRGESGGVAFKISGVPIRLGNLMLGGPDGDRLWGGGDLDLMFGQSENDELRGYDGNFEAEGLEIDLIVGGNGEDYLEGDDESEELATSFDLLFGGPGGDTMKGGANPDLLAGGDGDDVMQGDSNELRLLLSIDLLAGGNGGDTMDGGNSLDVLIGGDGNDTMKGDDERFGLVSPDFLAGGNGDDTMNGGSLIDVMVGGDGSDEMLGDSDRDWQPFSHDWIFGGDDDDDMNGGNGIDLLSGQDGCDRMLGDNSLQGRVSIDLLFGGPGDDFMDGGVNPDLIVARDGNDTMVGDAGEPWMFVSIDVMIGGNGCDTMRGGRALDFMWGGSGVDRIDGQWGFALLVGGDDGDTIDGGETFDVIVSGAGNDFIRARDFTDIVLAGDGNDCVHAGDGLDFVLGGEGDDCIHGDDTADAIDGEEGNDRLFGDGGSDLLFGSDGDDEIDGGEDIDIGVGGSGDDELWGGPGVLVIDLLFGSRTHQTGSNPRDCDCVPETCTGTLCVRKFEDIGADGTENSADRGLAGWQFGVRCGCETFILTTDAAGNTCLRSGGECTVEEILQPGWTPTTPIEQKVSLMGDRTTTAAFGNHDPSRGTEGEICIRKFRDDAAKPNGIQDPGEPGVESWFFDVTAGGVTTTVTTDAAGTVCIKRPAGTYEVAEVPRLRWQPTTPETQRVTIAAGEKKEVVFGNRRGVVSQNDNAEICIFKFHDRNRNGTWEPDEPGLPGWEFRIDNSTGTVATGGSGGWCTGALTGGSYAFAEVPKDGWLPTTPPTQVVTPRPGLSKWFFGNAQSCAPVITKTGALDSDSRNVYYTIKVEDDPRCPCKGPVRVSDILLFLQDPSVRIEGGKGWSQTIERLPASFPIWDLILESNDPVALPAEFRVSGTIEQFPRVLVNCAKIECGGNVNYGCMTIVIEP
jgi:Ca2+-binding RTX toxin-like protein